MEGECVWALAEGLEVAGWTTKHTCLKAGVHLDGYELRKFKVESRACRIELGGYRVRHAAELGVWWGGPKEGGRVKGEG